MYLILGVSLPITGFVSYRIWKTRRWNNVGLLVVALGITGIGSVFFWYTHRPIPNDTQRILYDGIHYIRDVRSEPRPVIIHVVRIDLDTPGLSFLVTPPDDSSAMQPRTTSQFLDEYDLQLAVNGDFYDNFPQTPDLLTPRGLTASRGVVYTWGYVSSRAYNTLFLSAENEATFTQPQMIYNAISGWQMIVRDGVYSPVRNAPATYIYEPQPRTLYALDASGETLIIIVVDGRQPHYSEGVTLEELGQIAIEYDAYHALNMDGGGSSTLVIEGEVLNSPVHSRIPGNQRPIATHLGVYVDDP